MKNQIEEARLYGERLIGRKLSDTEFEDALAYAIRKASLQGNGPDYVPLLLPDVIREREFELECLGNIGIACTATKEEDERWKRLLGITGEQLAQLREKRPELLAFARAAGIMC